VAPFYGAPSNLSALCQFRRRCGSIRFLRDTKSGRLYCSSRFRACSNTSFLFSNRARHRFRSIVASAVRSSLPNSSNLRNPSGILGAIMTRMHASTGPTSATMRRNARGGNPMRSDSSQSRRTCSRNCASRRRRSTSDSRPDMANLAAGPTQLSSVIVVGCRSLREDYTRAPRQAIRCQRRSVTKTGDSMGAHRGSLTEPSLLALARCCLGTKTRTTTDPCDSVARLSRRTVLTNLPNNM
jgi:hypothetical protein